MVAKKKLGPEELDYLLAAIAPVFIIGMIGSLVYFFISVIYAGEFRIRLMWILGLYTVAAVLVSRIAIEQNRILANGYLLCLSLATLVVAPQFFVVQGTDAAVGFVVLCGLLASVAWLADRITFDSTLIDEQLDSTGIGILQSLGLTTSERRSNMNRKGKPSEPETERVNKKVRKHDPGVWVLYFALLAIPFFGIGQLFINNDSDRQTAFLYLSLYLFCSLSLLVVISLLSLRKYLRERDVPMQMGFAIRWLAIGMMSVALLAGIFVLLPIPTGTLLSMKLPFRVAQREGLRADRWGWGNEGVQGEGEEEKARRGEEAEGEQNGDADRRENDVGKPSKKEQGDPSSNAQDSKTGQARQTSEESGKRDQPQPGQDRNANQPDDRQEQGNQQKEGEGPQQNRRGDQPAQKQQGNNDGRDPNAQAPAPQPMNRIDWDMAGLLRWIVMGILLLIAIVYGLRYRAELVQYLRGIWGWMLDLFRRNSAVLGEKNDEEAMEIASPFPPFDSFSDPFAKGNGMLQEEQIRYLYRAIQSWGHEHRVTCTEDETPDEFVRRLSSKYSEQKEAMVQLGRLVSRVAYARGRVHDGEIKPMQALWEWLQIGDRSHVSPNRTLASSG
jgi:hypothetical protein